MPGTLPAEAQRTTRLAGLRAGLPIVEAAVKLDTEVQAIRTIATVPLRSLTTEQLNLTQNHIFAAADAGAKATPRQLELAHESMAAEGAMYERFAGFNDGTNEELNIPQGADPDVFYHRMMTVQTYFASRAAKKTTEAQDLTTVAARRREMEQAASTETTQLQESRATVEGLLLGEAFTGKRDPQNPWERTIDFDKNGTIDDGEVSRTIAQRVTELIAAGLDEGLARVYGESVQAAEAAETTRIRANALRVDDATERTRITGNAEIQRAAMLEQATVALMMAVERNGTVLGRIEDAYNALAGKLGEHQLLFTDTRPHRLTGHYRDIRTHVEELAPVGRPERAPVATTPARRTEPPTQPQGAAFED
ncbi:MAG: hypothetical protein ACREGI_02175 [Candidatus Levyibacteriota bacterium]